jgi:restriction endonuclease S subunit
MKDSKTMTALGSVARVIAGAASSVYKDAIDGSKEFLLLSGTSITAENTIDIECLQKGWVAEGKNISHLLLQEDDVVLLARGSAIRAALVKKEVAEKAILTSANFLIIRTNKLLLKAAVLVVYFNSQQGQAALKALNKGSVIQSISASSISELVLPVPNMEVQEQIVELYEVSNETYAATLALAEQQKKLANAHMINWLWGLK